MRYVGVAALGALLCLSLPARADILINISKAQQQLTVTVNGIETYRWPVSTGKPGYDTPSGSFRAFRLEEVYFSKKYDDAPMPDAVFFHGGYAVHGTYEQARLGHAVSHGCVRLSRAHAATLFALVRRQGPSRTHIVVSDDRLASRLPDPNAEAIARPRPPEKRRPAIATDRKRDPKSEPRLASKPEPKPMLQPGPPAREQETVASAIGPIPSVKPERGFQEFSAPAEPAVAPDTAVDVKRHRGKPDRKVVARRDRSDTRRVAERARTNVRQVRAGDSDARMRALYRKYGFKWQP